MWPPNLTCVHLRPPPLQVAAQIAYRWPPNPFAWSPTKSLSWVSNPRIGGRPKLPHSVAHTRPTWAANPVQYGRPRSSNVDGQISPLRQPTPVHDGRPISVHLRPLQTATLVQCGRPDKPTTATHSCPQRATTPVHVGRPIRAQWSSTSRFHARLGGRPISAAPLAVHILRDMGGHNMQPSPSTIRLPIGRPLMPRPSDIATVPSFVMRAGTKTESIGGLHCVRPPTLPSQSAPLHYAPWVDARICARVVGPRMDGATKSPTPKGVRHGLAVVGDGLKAIHVGCVHVSPDLLDTTTPWGGMPVFLERYDLAFLDLESYTFKRVNHSVSKHCVELRSS